MITGIGTPSSQSRIAGILYSLKKITQRQRKSATRYFVSRNFTGDDRNVIAPLEHDCFTSIML